MGGVHGDQAWPFSAQSAKWFPALPVPWNLVPAAVDAQLELTTTGIAAGGDAIAREPEGRVVFVAGALPGERVLARAVQVRRDFVRAVTLEVVEAAPDRVEPPCPRVADGCGGCQLQHVTPAGQRRLKEAIVTDALRRIGKLDAPPVRPTVALSDAGYRTNVRAAVVDGRAGYRRFHGHDVVAVGDTGCLVAHPLIDELLRDGRFDGADEVALRCGARTGERLVAVESNPRRVRVPADVRIATPKRMAWFHEQAAGRTWRISAGSFFQSRPDGADVLARLVDDVVRRTPGLRTAVDLYSGVGLFAGVLADAGLSVRAVEGDVSGVADAKVNLADDDVSVIQADVTRWTPERADLVVADPARSGLGSRGVDVVAGCRPSLVVLVSCDPAALGRDVGLLAAKGYVLESATPVDLFPHTFHTEVVSVLRLS